MMSDNCHLNFKNIGHICPANFNNTITCTVIYKFPCGLVVFSRAIPVYIHTHAVDETFLRGYESCPHFLIFSPLPRGLRKNFCRESKNPVISEGVLCQHFDLFFLGSKL